jgi:hypothetical protein
MAMQEPLSLEETKTLEEIYPKVKPLPARNCSYRGTTWTTGTDGDLEHH